MDADLYKFPTREEWLQEMLAGPDGDSLVVDHPIYDVAKHFVTVPLFLVQGAQGPEPKTCVTRFVRPGETFEEPMNIAIMGAYKSLTPKFDENGNFDPTEPAVVVRIRYAVL